MTDADRIRLLPKIERALTRLDRSFAGYNLAAALSHRNPDCIAVHIDRHRIDEKNQVFLRSGNFEVFLPGLPGDENELTKAIATRLAEVSRHLVEVPVADQSEDPEPVGDPLFGIDNPAPEQELPPPEDQDQTDPDVEDYEQIDSVADNAPQNDDISQLSIGALFGMIEPDLRRAIVTALVNLIEEPSV